MSLSGLNYKIIQIENKLSNMVVDKEASKSVDNSEEVAKLEAQINVISCKSDSALEASKHVMISSKKDAEALLQRILNVEKVVDKLAKQLDVLSKKSQDSSSQV
mgnify:CR=1 FL=1